MAGASEHADPESLSAHERALLRTQREANEQLVLAALRARAETAAAETQAEELRVQTDGLLKSEEQLRTFADMLPLLAWVAAPDGAMVWFNRRWFDFTGTSFHDQEGWKWQSVPDPGDLARIVAKWKASLASGMPWEDELRLRGRDGRLRWFLSRAVPLRDDRGNVVRWFGTNVDVEAQKRAEEGLRLRNTLAMVSGDVGRAFTLSGAKGEVLGRCSECIVGRLDAASACIWTVDASGLYLELQTSPGVPSDAAMALARVPVDDPRIAWLVSARQPRMTHDSGHPGWAHLSGLARERSERGEPDRGSFGGYPLMVADELVGLFVIRSSGELDEDTTRALASVADTMAIGIARLRQEEERSRLLKAEQEARTEAEAANRVKDEFLATMSHELRTPLNAILGWATLLRRSEYDRAATDRALATIERNARAQSLLIDDVLDVSRIIGGRMRFEMQHVDLNAVARAALEVVRPTADAKAVQLLFDPLPEEAVEGALGDADRLQQVVWNLLSNGVKFTPPHGLVSLRVRRVGETFTLTVYDTGTGIASEHLSVIFERFRQADSSTTRRQGGLGLGLAIVQHIVQMHGGTVTAESDGLGAGSTFTVVLPVRPVRVPALMPASLRRSWVPAVKGGPERAAPRELLSGATVLVVDDETDSRVLVESALRGAGARVATADSASSALDYVASHHVDAIVSDIAMPGEDGLAFVRRLRALPASHGGEVPALALSAYARVEDASRAKHAGFQSHMAKPADIDALIESVAALLSLRPRIP
jgi:PAS domain S-box-containing protein